MAIVCGRINLWVSAAELAEVFDLFCEPKWSPRYNLGPMQSVLTIRTSPQGVRQAEPMQWGLVPNWSKSANQGPPLNNARGETVATKPTFSESFRRRRCLIPANGFYEWKRLDNKSKQPWNLFRADGRPLAMAGIWDRWQTPDGNLLESCAVITTTANAFMAEIHDRMPVILGEDSWTHWLSNDETEVESLLKLVRPCPNEWLRGTPVSAMVNQIRHDSAECIQSVKETRTLF
jgi:putative SOS response-associated peptidase YedK